MRLASLASQLSVRGLGLVGVCALAFGLAGCGSSGTGIGSMLMRGSAEESKAQDLSQFTAQPTCPKTEIRYGAESLSVFETGKQGDPNALRYQASVQRVSRDCSQVGDNMQVRLGVAGRVIAGPKGGAGTVQVPVRVAATRGDEVLLSKVYMIPVSVNAPDFSSLWTKVDDTILIPVAASADTQIFVGVDDKATAKDAAPQKPSKPKKG